MTTGFRQRPQDRPPHLTPPGPNAGPDNDEPLPDAMYQGPHFTRTMEIVQTVFLDQEATLVSGDSPVYYRDPQGKQRFVKPDCYVVFGVDQRAIRERNGYYIEEVERPPDFALEIASESTADNDIGFKRNLYARLGIGEYWRFDASGGDYYGEPLAGEELVDGAYRPIELHQTPGGVIWGHSPTLGLDLCWEDRRLQFYDPAKGEYRRDLREAEAALMEMQDEMTRAEERLNNEQAARRTAEQTAHDEQAARRTAEQTARDEQAAREAAEERERRLLEQIRSLSEGREPPEQRP